MPACRLSKKGKFYSLQELNEGASRREDLLIVSNETLPDKVIHLVSAFHSVTCRLLRSCCYNVVIWVGL